MKESPILFSTPMVQDILDGLKTMTRRIFKDNPRLSSDFSKINLAEWFRDYQDLLLSYSSFGKPGDMLWVREEHKIQSLPGNFWECEFRDGSIIKFYYKQLSLNTNRKLNSRKTLGKWQRGRFLPKEFARIWLEITDMKVERLHDISQGDAKKEGVKHVIDKITGYCGYDYLSGGYNLMTTPYLGFMSLWKKINGKESWDSNPWVWVISFKVISITGRPTK